MNVPVHTHDSCVAWWGDDAITVRQLCIGTEDTSACGVTAEHITLLQFCDAIVVMLNKSVVSILHSMQKIDTLDVDDVIILSRYS